MKKTQHRTESPLTSSTVFKRTSDVAGQSAHWPALLMWTQSLTTSFVVQAVMGPTVSSCTSSLLFCLKVPLPTVPCLTNSQLVAHECHGNTILGLTMAIYLISFLSCILFVSLCGVWCVSYWLLESMFRIPPTNSDQSAVTFFVAPSPEVVSTPYFRR
jgi:ABC-type antimicrobial peptide transport system permease subunit